MRKNLEEVLDRDLLNEVKAIFTKYAVKDIVAVVRVRDALHEKLYRSQHRHVEGKEKPCIWQHVAETIDEEEEKCYE